MKLAVVGTGYVGLVSGACFADFGHDVTCIDSDGSRIEAIGSRSLPFFEPGLQELVHRHVGSGRLRLTTDLRAGVRDASVIFLAVGTPAAQGGGADLTQVTAATAAIAPELTGYRIVATKSTVPVGTGAKIAALLRGKVPCGAQVDVVSNPEFLREGSAIADFMRPDRVVIGTTSEQAADVMRAIYRPLYLIETPLIFTTLETAEMIKYASNGFLAVKISFINELANLCDRTGADVHVVSKAMGLDNRIGPKFLHPGPGYGGSCFPKDTRALVNTGAGHGVAMEVVSAAIRANERQHQLTVEKIAHAVGGLAGRTIAVLGLAFKPNTSDTRESPACHICRALATAGACVRAYDPAASGEAASELQDVEICADAYTAVAGADAVVIATEWNEFRSMDLERLRAFMLGDVVVDCRNVLDPEQATTAGFAYYSTGRGARTRSSPAGAS